MKNQNIALENIKNFNGNSKPLIKIAEFVICGEPFTFLELSERFEITLHISRGRIRSLKERGFVFKDEVVGIHGLKKMRCIDCHSWSPNNKPRNRRESNGEPNLIFVSSSSPAAIPVNSLINQVFGA